MTNKEFKKDCIFCQIAEKKLPSWIIYEDEYTLAFLDIFPIQKGHILIIPKKHFEDFYTTSNLYLERINFATKNCIKQLKKNLNINDFNIVNNIGKLAGQEVFHYHVHIIPHSEQKIVENPRKDRLKMSNEEFLALQKRLQFN